MGAKKSTVPSQTTTISDGNMSRNIRKNRKDYYKKMRGYMIDRAKIAARPNPPFIEKWYAEFPA
jgi:hypothetical protein